MPSKYEISAEAQVLLKLLRIALGTEPMSSDCRPVEPFPQTINWAEVIRMSYEQKVSSLAVDGLKASGYDPRESKSGQQLEDLNAILKPWFNDVKNNEDSYDYYLTVLATLCQIFSANGLKTIILKGYGLSKNYPVPSHRGAGDIDLFVLDENNNLATEKALDIIENQLKIQTKKVPHDYEFTFKGLEVELHYDATNAYFDTKEEKYITKRLTEMMPMDITPCPGIPGAWLSGAAFNVLYLIRHCFGHFYTASGNLRQYVDWLTFVRAHHNEIDWNSIDKELGRTTMKPFFDGLVTLLNHHLGLDFALCPIASPDSRTEQFLLQDTKGTIPYGRHLHQRICYFYGNRKKLKFISSKGWVQLLAGSIMESVKQICR